MKTIASSEHEGPLTIVSWQDVDARAILEDVEGRVYYGITTGAKIVAASMVNAKHAREPAHATHLLIDVSGTGRTAEEWSHQFNLPVAILFDKQREDRARGWLVMPWEDRPDAEGNPHQGPPKKTGLNDGQSAMIEGLRQVFEQSADELSEVEMEEFFHLIRAAEDYVFALPARRAYQGGDR